MREAACCRGASCLLCFPFGGPQPYGRAGSRGIWGSWGWRSPAEAALGAGSPRYHFVHLQEHFGEAKLEGIVPPHPLLGHPCAQRCPYPAQHLETA